MSVDEKHRGLATRLAILLALATIAAYARVAWNGFTTFDDHDYLTKNPEVLQGFTAKGIAWAFTTNATGNWHPLTWLSHMLDCQLFGLQPAGHHLVGLAIHVASSLLLFRFFLKTTGATFASLFVAAAFALHPLHVESVAWASERKDLLCALLWMLALLAYARYVERPSSTRFALVLLLHALGLLAKPMIVTLPFTLLLLDFWPFRRLAPSRERRSTIPRLVAEKLPFLVLSLVSCVVTYKVQSASGAMTGVDALPLLVRAENSIVSYTAYLAKMFWPAHLAAYYPHPFAAYPFAEFAGATLLLAAITAGAALAARSRPWLLFGWLWFLGTLVPVIGIVQVGGQAMADRYSYVPMIGIAVAVAWTAAELAGRFQSARAPIAGLFSVAALAWGLLTWRQVGFWKDDFSLFSIASTKVEDDYRIHGNLGNWLLKQGRSAEAIEELRRALDRKPDFAEGHNDLGLALEDVGRKDEAIDEYRTALILNPLFAEAHGNLAGLLGETKRFDEAIEHYERALEIRPDLVETRFDYARTLLASGRESEGVAELRKVLERAPGHEGAAKVLRSVLDRAGAAR